MNDLINELRGLSLRWNDRAFKLNEISSVSTIKDSELKLAIEVYNECINDLLTILDKIEKENKDG